MDIAHLKSQIDRVKNEMVIFQASHTSSANDLNGPHRRGYGSQLGVEGEY